MIEKVVAAGIIAATVSLATPQIMEIFHDNQSKAIQVGIHEFYKTGVQVSLAGGDVTLCPLAKGLTSANNDPSVSVVSAPDNALNASCGNDWSNGFLLFKDSNKNNNKDAHEAIIKVAALETKATLVTAKENRFSFSQGVLLNPEGFIFNLTENSTT